MFYYNIITILPALIIVTIASFEEPHMEYKNKIICPAAGKGLSSSAVRIFFFLKIPFSKYNRLKVLYLHLELPRD